MIWSLFVLQLLLDTEILIKKENEKKKKRRIRIRKNKQTIATCFSFDCSNNTIKLEKKI